MIYTIDARNSVQLQTIQGYFGIPADEMHQVIQGMHELLLEELDRKKIDYKSLKPALVPQKKQREIVIVVDSSLTGEDWYGHYVFSYLLQAFDKESVFSVLDGDYINRSDEAFYEFLLKNNLEEQLGFSLPDYKTSSQYYLIYLNNVTVQREKQLLAALKEMKGFMGIIDVTFTSPFKEYISTILAPAFIKYKNLILADGEEEYGVDSDVNELGYPFEAYGFQLCNFYRDLYDMFLSYKIERQYQTSEDLADQLMSLNSISPVVGYLHNATIEIPPGKLDYLLQAKQDTMARLELDEMGPGELEQLIEEKINSNYIYELDFLEAYQVAKFNIMLEFEVEDKKYKIVLGLKYNAKENKVSLITMF